MTQYPPSELEDAKTTIGIYREALAAARYEAQRLRECLKILEAEIPKPKKKPRKSLHSFIREY